MNSFLKTNKNLLTYSIILLLVVPIFGFKFLISFFGNILLLLFLIPLLLILIAFLSFNFIRAKIKICDKCGTISFGSNDTCMNCGSYINEENINQLQTKPSETTIEVKAEEIK